MLLGRKGQAGRRLHDARRAHHQHQVGGVAEVVSPFQRHGGQHLLEPDDIGPHPGAAVRASWRAVLAIPRQRGHVDQRRIALAVGEALVAPDIAMQRNDITAAGGGVQPVDILRDDDQLGQHGLDLRNGAMRRVGARLGQQLAPVFVPIPDQLGIAAEGARRGKLLRVELGPQAVQRIPKGGDAALLRDARPGQHDRARAAAQHGRHLGDVRLGNGRHPLAVRHRRIPPPVPILSSVA